MTELAEYWNNRAESYDDSHGGENHAAWIRELARLVPDKSGTVLDAGTGTGFLAIKLAELGCRVTASDISDGMLAVARRKAAAQDRQIRFLPQRGETLPLAEDEFDIVISSRVLGLLEKPMDTLHDWIRVLRPGGKFIALMRLMPMPEDETQCSAAPLCYASAEEFETALIKAGLIDANAEILPEDMMLTDHRRWYVFSGRKPETDAEKKQAIANRWSRQSADFRRIHGPENDPANLAEWRSTLERFIGLSGKGKTLDIGTGTGFLSVMASELGYDSTGIDLTKEMLVFAEENAKNRGVTVTLQQADGDRLPFEDNTFDAVMNCRVLWTTLDPVASLREWMRVAKPGGKILSFVRMGKDAGGIASPMLPMERATEEKHLDVYREAGCIRVSAQWLPDSHILIPGPSWIVFYGEKP